MGTLNTGPADKSTESPKNDKQQQGNKVVSCFAKFRPCEDWRGEYGFDWVREGKEDYKEVNSVGSSSAYDECVPEDEPLQYLFRAKHTSLVIYEFNKAKYNGAWSFKIVTKDNANGNESVDDCEKVMSEDNTCELRMRHYVELRDAVCPLWSPKNNNEDLYIPIYDVDLDDNTTKENRRDDYIDKMVSFKYNGRSFAFYYSDARYHSKSVIIVVQDDYTYELPLSKEAIKEQKKNARKQKIKEIKTTSTHKMKRILDFSYNFSKNTIETCSVRDEINEKGEFVMIEKNKEKENENEKKEKEKKLYISTAISKEIPLTDEFGVEQTDENGEVIMTKNPLFNEDNDGYAVECWKEFIQGQEELFHKLECNEDISLASFPTDGSFDSIKIMVNGPTSLVEKGLSITQSEGYKKEGEERTWFGNPIYSWREGLERDFHVKKTDGKPIVLKDKEGKEQKYFIPVLSIGNFDVKNTIFNFSWVNSWNPDKKTFSPSKGIPVLVKIDGEVPDKITFVSSNPDKLSVEQPKRTSKEFSIKLIPNFAGAAETVLVTAKADKGTGKEEEIGELEVDFKEKKETRVWFIKVDLEEEGFSASHSKAVKDQEAAVATAFYQAGIKIWGFHGELSFTNPNDVKKIRKKEEDYNKLLTNAFAKRYDPKEIWGFKHDFLVFYLPVLYTKEKIVKKIKEGKEIEETEIEYIIADTTGTKEIFVSKYIAINRRQAYSTAHEMGHALGLPHIFQSNNFAYDNKFCFKKGSTTNIMDYDIDGNGIQYSFRKNQWKTIRNKLESCNK